MEPYINKAALIAEIDDIESIAISEFNSNHSRYSEAGLDICHRLKNFINTLEVKEVDFDVLGILAEHLIACEAHGITPKYRDREIDLLEKLKNNKAQKEN